IQFISPRSLIYLYRWYRNLHVLHTFTTRRSSDLQLKDFFKRLGVATVEDRLLDGIGSLGDDIQHREIVVHDGIQERIEENGDARSEEHTSELQSRENLVCRLLHDKKNELNMRKDL